MYFDRNNYSIKADEAGLALKIKKAEKAQIYFFDAILNDPFLHYTVDKMYDQDDFYAFFKDDFPIGAAVIFHADNITAEIPCFYVAPEHGEHSPLFLEMLCREYAKRGISRLKICEIPDRQDPKLSDYIATHGTITEKSLIYRCRLDRPTLEKWGRIRSAHSERISEYLKERGWESVCFADADKEMISKLKQSSSSYDSRYNIHAVMYGRFGRFIPELSSMASLHEQPYAVAMLVEADKKDAVFQLVSASFASPQAGVVMLAVTDAIDRLFLSKYQTVSFCFFENNREMQQIAKRIFAKMAYRVTGQITYTLQLKGM